jgi:hypothetical protein
VILAAHPIDLHVVLGAHKVRQDLHKRVRFYLTRVREFQLILLSISGEVLIIDFIITGIACPSWKVLWERLVKTALNRD